MSSHILHHVKLLFVVSDMMADPSLNAEPPIDDTGVDYTLMVSTLANKLRAVNLDSSIAHSIPTSSITSSMSSAAAAVVDVGRGGGGNAKAKEVDRAMNKIYTDIRSYDHQLIEVKEMKISH